MNTADQVQETDRVRQHTSPEVLRRIDEDFESSIRFFATQPDWVITERIEQLEHEWDIERVLETNASALTLTGLFFGLTRGKKWFLLSLTVMGFLMQHAVSGWCPPVPALRRFGYRTRREIDREKFALKALRGDFKNLPPRQEPSPTDVQQFVQAFTE